MFGAKEGKMKPETLSLPPRSPIFYLHSLAWKQQHWDNSKVKGVWDFSLFPLSLFFRQITACCMYVCVPAKISISLLLRRHAPMENSYAPMWLERYLFEHSAQFPPFSIWGH